MEPIYFFYLGRSRIEGRKDNKKGLVKSGNVRYTNHVRLNQLKQKIVSEGNLETLLTPFFWCKRRKQ